jgi:hypothetical protein
MLASYGPYISVAVVLAVLFILWAFFGGKQYDFVGLAPLAPETCGSYTGSIYNWGNITPAPGYDPINGQTCIPPDVACPAEAIEIPEVQPITTQEIIEPSVVPQTKSIDITPVIPQEFRASQIPEHAAVCAPVIETPAIIAPVAPPITYAKNKPANKGRFVSKGERICCSTMSNIYGVPFDTIRPSWLRNPETGENLELDCYNDDLKIAVEYNGIQHYKWPNFTNQTEEQFINQVRRDEAKVELCKRNNVYLITVPYEVPHEMIASFILSHLPETISRRLQEEQVCSSISV